MTVETLNKPNNFSASKSLKSTELLIIIRLIPGEQKDEQNFSCEQHKLEIKKILN